jgi:hypothetical protein
MQMETVSARVMARHQKRAMSYARPAAMLELRPPLEKNGMPKAVCRR